MKMKKWLSVVLAIVLVMSSFTNIFAMSQADLSKEGDRPAGVKFQGERIASDPRAIGLTDQDKVRIIVELEQKPVIEYAIEKGVELYQLDAATTQKVSDELVGVQEQVKSTIQKNKVNIEYHQEFVHVFNGFSGTTTLKEAKIIERLPNVKRVTIANAYDRPVPEMFTSVDIVNAPETWLDLELDGEGTVIAILDTGVDPNHQDMQKVTNPDNVKLTADEVAEISTKESLPGKWRNVKVPYGYNYMDNNQEILDLGSQASHHGMHVAGTAGANGRIKGVAPEAQILAMKVFGNDPDFPSTYGDIYVRAIEDALKLGADVINMSLGSSASFVLEDAPERAVIDKAAESGVIVSVSAGNANKFGSGFADPYAKNPDIGVVGAPSLYPGTFSVASIENTHIQANALLFRGQLVPYAAAGNKDPVAVLGVNRTYVDCGLGQPSQIPASVNGKVALISRGEIGFTDKILNAQAKGAIGVVIYNNAGNDLINMAYPDTGVIPAVFIGQTYGTAMKAAAGTTNGVISFRGDAVSAPNPSSGKMSTFTSWGTTPSLEFKPEITAPGGQIYSTLQDNQYGIMSGTSMAAPHVAGGSALILQRVDKDFDLSGLERSQMAKNLMMATAKPVKDRFAYVSPRRQGAGLMDLYAAATTPAVVTNTQDGISKVTLKQIGDQVSFDLQLENFGADSIVYDLGYTIGTDLAVAGDNWGEAQPIIDENVTFTYKGTPIQNLVVPSRLTVSDAVYDDSFVSGYVYASSYKVNFTVNIDLSNAKDWAYEVPLSEIFPNGNFVEGFVLLEPALDNIPLLSIPYVGFYGDWDQAPIIDDSIYDQDADPFYGKITSMAWLDEEGYFNFLGLDSAGKANADKIAFSPNGDGYADHIRPILTFLRNAREFEVDILDANQKVVRKLARDEYLRKSYYDSGRAPRFTASDSWIWDGKVNNRIVPGQYYYRIRARIDYPGAQWQERIFPVYVDIEAPTITKTRYTQENGKLTVLAYDDHDIKSYHLVNLTTGSAIATAVHDKALGGVEFDVSKVSKGTPLAVFVEDFAGNMSNTEIKWVNDREVPEVIMPTPEFWGIYNTREVEVVGWIEDTTPITAFELKLNGTPIPEEDISFAYNEMMGDYDFYTVLQDLEDGFHRLNVLAEDSVENVIEFERKFFVDATAATIELETLVPRLVEYDADTIDIKGMVGDNFPQLLVKVNGNVLYNKEADITRWRTNDDIQPIVYSLSEECELKYGENLIVIEVQDFGGNTTVASYAVYRKNSEEDPTTIEDLEPGIPGLEVGEFGMTPTEKVSADRPVTIQAKANQEVQWNLRITGPDGEIAEEIQMEADVFVHQWAPMAYNKHNGEYEAVLSVISGGEVVWTEKGTFQVYNYPIEIQDLQVIGQDGYTTVEASLLNLGPKEKDPMLVIKVTNEAGKVINISTARMKGVAEGRTVELSSGFALDEPGTYKIDAYVWDGWVSPAPLAESKSIRYTKE